MKIVSKIHQKSIKNQWKWSRKSMKNQWKSIKKQIKNKMRFGIDFWWLLDGFWGGFGRILAPRGRVLGDFGLQVGAQNRPKSIPRAIWNVINFLMDLKIDFWSDLVPSWTPKPSKNEVSWLPNRCKLGCWLETCFWKDLGIIFNVFLPQHTWPK